MLKNNQIIMEETWMEAIDFPSYEVSNTGKVRRALNGKVLKPQPSDYTKHRQYQVVRLWCDKKKYTKKVAKLVWESFNKCKCKEHVDHIDNNIHNNNLDNLQCISPKENSAKRSIYRTSNKYNLTKELKMELIKQYREKKITSWDIMKEHGIPTNYFHMIVQRGTWDRLLETNGQ